MWKEFKGFAMRGNVIDLAIGVIIGGAFGAIVNSLVTDVLTPVLGIFTGKMNFKDRFFALNGHDYATVEEARKATSVISYGNFIDAIIKFLIIAFVLFLIVRQLNRFTKPVVASAAPMTRECPECLSVIPINAKRCAHCSQPVS